MRLKYALASGVLVLTIATPALGKPTIIHELGTAPLLGASNTGSEELGKILAREALVRRAGFDLGLTPEEFTAFLQQWRTHQMRWVTIPRHLDGMSWAAEDRVHVIRDVYIPAQTKGWEVDIQGNGRTISLFLPAACGNLSILRRPKRVVEAPPPQPLPTPPAPSPTQAPPPPAPAPAPAPESTPEVAAVAPPAGHSHPLWPYLIPLLIHTHHVGPPPPPTGPPPPPPPGFFSAA